MLSSCIAGEDSWESLGQQDQPINPKVNQPWIFIGRADAEAEAPMLWPPDAKSWVIGWDRRMASSTQWTWVWANSGRWWRIEKPGMLQSMGLQRVGHNLVTKQPQQKEEYSESCEKKSTDCMIAFTWNSRKSKLIYSDRKQISGSLEKWWSQRVMRKTSGGCGYDHCLDWTDAFMIIYFCQHLPSCTP